MSDAMEGGVRRGRRSASTKGSFADTTSAKPFMPGAMVFGYFLPKQKVARAVD